MSYQPLARKYRPALFQELVGQEAVATALANAIAIGREPHALLFTGVRGVGKTTVARLYAKALNCSARIADPTRLEPCNTCESCRAIAKGLHEDVLEIDGASNTGVADVRSLQETIDYRPQRSAFKVYIIDEVHMLSQAAFNALLKTLEEPPAHVVFVFATTEIQKVPQTILSRCQTFYLRKLPTALILGRLKHIIQAEGLPAEDKALAIVAREGHGSMRDALTMLDQAIALGHGQVSMAGLNWLVSNLSSTLYLDLLAALTVRDAAAALRVIDRLDQSGAEFPAVVEELAQLARHAFVVQGLGVKALDVGLLGLDDTEVAALTALAQSAGVLDLNRIFRTLVKCRTELDGSALDRYVVENYLFEWCLDPGLPSVEQLLAGGAVAAPAVAKGGATAAAVPSAAAPVHPATLPSPAAPPGPRPSLSEALAKAALTPPAPPQAAPQGQPVRPAPPPIPKIRQLPGTWRELVEAWKQQKPLQARKLEEAHPLEYSAQRIVVVVSEDSYLSRSLLLKDEQARIKEQFRELFDFNGTFVVQAKKEVPLQAAPLPETLLTTRDREAAGRRERLIDEARNAPFTKDLLSTLGGELEDVRILGSEQP